MGSVKVDFSTSVFVVVAMVMGTSQATSHVRVQTKSINITLNGTFGVAVTVFQLMSVLRRRNEDRERSRKEKQYMRSVRDRSEDGKEIRRDTKREKKHKKSETG